MPHAREILVRGPNWVGDLVMASPGFRALRCAFPEARIRLLARPELLPLMAGAPWFDALLPLRSHRLGLRALLREARALAAAGPFDLGLCLPDSFSAALLLRAARVKRVVGYRRNFRRALLHQAVPLPSGVGRRVLMPRERHVLGLVEAVGAAAAGTHTELFTTDEEESEARRVLEAQAVDPAAPCAVLAPGAAYGPSKCWPPDYFAATGDAFARAGVQVLIVGAASERARCQAVANAMQQTASNLCGALSLGSLKAVLRRARVLVANDAGARHIAVAFGVPCVVLMGPTAIEKTNLNLSRVAVLSADVACRPCYQRQCPIDHRCMTRIAPEQVVAVAAPALHGDGAAFRGGAQVIIPAATHAGAVC